MILDSIPETIKSKEDLNEYIASLDEVPGIITFTQEQLNDCFGYALAEQMKAEETQGLTRVRQMRYFGDDLGTTRKPQVDDKGRNYVPIRLRLKLSTVNPVPGKEFLG